VQRLLALIPWVAAEDGPTIDEVCARFEISERELLADLSLVRMVGVPPYTPDELFDVVVEAGRVWVYLSPSFRHPLRFTPEQGLSLVAAGASVLAVPGADPEGPLARALTKVAAVLDLRTDEAVDVDLGTAEPGTLAVFREAVASSHQVEIDYYAYGRDERTTRVVDPYRLYADQGEWYVVGHCHRADGERVFRLDRVAAATPLDTTFEPPSDPPALGVYEAAPGDPRVTLELEADAGWVAEQYPAEEVVELGDGRLRATLAISAVPWLERLLLRLGPAARVVEQRGGSVDLAGVGADAARRVLARYRDRPGQPLPSPAP
jgi:proteasome accessory factor C